MTSTRTIAVAKNGADQEAVRVLPHLCGSSRVLLPHASNDFGVFVLKRSRHPVVVTPIACVRAWLRQELIEPSSDKLINKDAGGSAFVLSRIGAAFVARANAAHDKFAAQHRALLPTNPRNGNEAVAGLNAAESPLAWLRLRQDVRGRPYIGETEFLAGERLRTDFTLALLSPKSTTSWPIERVDCSRRVGFSPTHESETAIAARKRFWAALDAVGHEFASVLVGICCHLEGLEALEARLGLPKRSGKTVLRLGLQMLARHYGLACSDDRSRIRSFSQGALPAE